jgi:hypothetical protein
MEEAGGAWDLNVPGNFLTYEAAQNKIVIRQDLAIY